MGAISQLMVVSAPTHGGGVPVVVIVVAVVAALLALIGLAWGYWRWRGFEARWLAHVLHVLGEAGYRLEAGIAEFADWVRIGR
jgi:tetrahydromethanopterin S-methyltransferase subunit D